MYDEDVKNVCVGVILQFTHIHTQCSSRGMCFQQTHPPFHQRNYNKYFLVNCPMESYLWPRSWVTFLCPSSPSGFSSDLSATYLLSANTYPITSNFFPIIASTSSIHRIHLSYNCPWPWLIFSFLGIHLFPTDTNISNLYWFQRDPKDANIVPHMVYVLKFPHFFCSD